MSFSAEDIIALEHQTWRALMISGKDLLPYLSKDCCMCFPGGVIFDASSEPPLVEILVREDMKPWTSYDMKGIRVLPLGQEGSAAICYEVIAKREGTVYEALITSVWRRGDGGKYEMAVHQQTPA